MLAKKVIEKAAFVGSIIGLNQIKVDNSLGRINYKTSQYFTILSILLSLAFIILIPIQVIFREFWDDIDFAQKISFYNWNIMHPLACAIAVLVGIAKQKGFSNELNLLNSLIQEISNLSGDTPKCNPIIYLIVGITMSVITISMNLPATMWANIGEHVCTMYIAIIIIYFNCFVLVISSTLSSLNKGLKKYLISQLEKGCIDKCIYFLGIGKSRMAKTIDIVQPDNRVQQYNFLHHRLYVTSQQIQNKFATAILFIICHMTMVAVTASYNLIRMNIFYLKLSIWAYVSITWISYSITLLILLVAPGNQIYNEAQQLITTVNQFLASNIRKDIGNQLKIFLMTLQHEKVTFTPHNVATLNYNLLISLTGLIISYLVIVTQIPNQA